MTGNVSTAGSSIAAKTAIDPFLDRLTDEQLIAACTELPRVFIEAVPGSGKTTVAAQRFGALRFALARFDDGNLDTRAVVALSFTRSATWELRRRVRRSWGPSALSRPHRIATLDTLMIELVEYLLQIGALHWPSGHTHLEVHDTWKQLVRHAFMRTAVGLVLDRSDVKIGTGLHATRTLRVEPEGYAAHIHAGICTHEDVRAVLELASSDQAIAWALRDRLRSTMRALIIDEVFDANGLDILLLELAIQAGIQTTVVGDRWQAVA